MLDVFQSNVVGRKRSSRRCCAVEGWLPLHVVWIGPCFPSIEFRPQNVDSPSGYDVIWVGLGLWCLDAGFATALFTVCCRWCDACTNYCDVCPVSMRYPCLTAKLLLATSLRPNTWQNPARRTKEMLVILRRSRWIYNSAATRSPSKRFPRYDCFEGTWSRKMKFSLLSKFLLNRPQTRANVFYNGYGKDVSAVIFFHEMKRVQSTRQYERP